MRVRMIKQDEKIKKTTTKLRAQGKQNVEESRGSQNENYNENELFKMVIYGIKKSREEK